MGNRAIITTEAGTTGIYLHWNGGRDSVRAFLKYCEIHGFHSPDTDNYGFARLCQVIANFFGGDGLSVGIVNCGPESGRGCDNGAYIVKGWQIAGRLHYEGAEQNEYDLEEFLLELDTRQPQGMQLGEKRIKFCLAPKTNGDFATFARAEMKARSKFYDWNTVAKRAIGEQVLCRLNMRKEFTPETVKEQLYTEADSFAQSVTGKHAILALLDYTDHESRLDEYLALPLEELQERLQTRSRIAAGKISYFVGPFTRGEHIEG